MQYQDLIYGELQISEPLILELIESPSIQRLKGVDQAGYRPLLKKQPSIEVDDVEHSRFAHSLGVYLLLNMYGASLEEQIAGLIHDVSHSAFSHCIDYVLESGSEKKHTHQDNVFESFIKRSEIPRILGKHGIDVDYVLNEQNFPLKERELPDLCADRLDYSLRTALIFGEAGRQTINSFLENLLVQENQWVFRNPITARQYAELFFVLNRDYYAGFASAVMFNAVGNYLKHALRKGYIYEEDLFTTDQEVLAKIERHLKHDAKLRLFFRRMSRNVRCVNDPNNYDAHVFCKSRIVDPLTLSDREVKRISEIDPRWREVVKSESLPKEYFLRYLDEEQ
jgi:hypothetical protein